MERKIDFALPVNQEDHPVTISRKHIMIAEETFLISGEPGSNEDESVDHFIKTITIAGNHKSIFTKRKNTFAKEKNQNDLSGNRFSSLENIFFVPKNRSCGNILQEAGNKLKNQNTILSKAGNVLKEDERNIIISGNKLKETRSLIQKDERKLMEDQSNLKNLGEEMIFVETFRGK